MCVPVAFGVYWCKYIARACPSPISTFEVMMCIAYLYMLFPVCDLGIRMKYGGEETSSRNPGCANEPFM